MSWMPQPKGNNSRLHILQDKDHLKKSMAKMSNTNTNAELVISCIKTNPFLSLLTPNIQWVSHPSLAKPTISTSKRLLISEVPSEARWVGRCKQVSRQVSEITQPRTTWFNLATQRKGVFKDYIHWTIINMDLIISRTIFAKEKNTNCQTRVASTLYLAIFLISLEFARRCALSLF